MLFLRREMHRKIYTGSHSHRLISSRIRKMRTKDFNDGSETISEKRTEKSRTTETTHMGGE